MKTLRKTLVLTNSECLRKIHESHLNGLINRQLTTYITVSFIATRFRGGQNKAMVIARPWEQPMEMV
jgi:hypothetical protein